MDDPSVATHALPADVNLPEMNGRDLATRIEGLRPAIRTVFMSGYAAGILSSRGVEEAKSPLLRKPFSVSDLSVALRRALSDRS